MQGQPCVVAPGLGRHGGLPLLSCMPLRPIPTVIGLGSLCIVLYMWGLGDVPFYTKGQPREASVVWEIYTNGEWILPLRNGHLIPSKPPLFHWLAALCSFALGELSELTIRLPSAVLAIVGVLLTYYAGSVLWGIEAGLVAGLIVATSFEWLRAATAARVDMTLTACMVMAFVFFLFLYRRQAVSLWQALLFFGCLGLATLAKGPVGAVLPCLTIIVFLAFRRDFAFLCQLHLVPGIVFFLVVAGSWYGLALWQGGEEFFTKQIMKENVLRFFASGAAGAGHEHPFYYFIPTFFLGMLPWSFFFPPLVIFLYQRRKTLHEHNFLYLIVWIVTVFLFYSVSSSKRSVYILPLYPAVALLLGAWWQELRRGTVVLPQAFTWILSGGGYGCLGILAVGLLGVGSQALGADPLGLIRPFLHPRDQDNLPLFTGIVAEHPLAFAIWAVSVGVAAIGLVFGLRKERWGQVFAGLAVFTIATFLLVQGVFQPTIAAARTFRPFMAQVGEKIGDAPLFFYRTFDSGALFYANRRIPFYDSIAQDAVQRSVPHFLLMWEEEWKKFAEWPELEETGVSQGTGPKGKQPLILVYVPAQTKLPAEHEGHAERGTVAKDAL